MKFYTFWCIFLIFLTFARAYSLKSFQLFCCCFNVTQCLKISNDAQSHTGPNSRLEYLCVPSETHYFESGPVCKWVRFCLIDFWNKAKYSAFTASKYLFKYILYALIYKSWNCVIDTNVNHKSISALVFGKLSEFM